MFGRTVTNKCGQGTLTNCKSLKSLSRVKQECENKNQCTIIATNKWFGDPCARIRKYLEVEYVCIGM